MMYFNTKKVMQSAKVLRKKVRLESGNEEVNSSIVRPSNNNVVDIDQ